MKLFLLFIFYCSYMYKFNNLHVRCTTKNQYKFCFLLYCWEYEIYEISQRNYILFFFLGRVIVTKLLASHQLQWFEFVLSPYLFKQQVDNGVVEHLLVVACTVVVKDLHCVRKLNLLTRFLIEKRRSSTLNGSSAFGNLNPSLLSTPRHLPLRFSTVSYSSQMMK